MRPLCTQLMTDSRTPADFAIASIAAAMKNVFSVKSLPRKKSLAMTVSSGVSNSFFFHAPAFSTSAGGRCFFSSKPSSVFRQ